MKILILTFSFLALNISGFSQAREDKAMPVMGKKSVGITKATGWAQNETTGKWVSNENVSSPEVVGTNEYLRTRTDQNLNWFRTATVSYGGKKYYMFFYERLTGEYTYPELRQDWVTYLATRYILIDSAEYFKFKKKIAQKNGTVINLQSILGNKHDIKGPYTESAILANIAKILEDKYLTSDFCFNANSQYLDGHDVVRFRMPEECFWNYKFPKEYFEIPLEDFNNLFVE